MADQSFDPDPTVEHEDIDFTFEDGGTDQAGLDDFDFDIGDGSVPFQADAALDVTATEGSNPIGNDEATLPEDAAVLDEIDYEEAGDEPAEPNAEQAVEPTTSLAEDLDGQEVNRDNVDDEINYEEDVEGDLGASAETDEAIQHAGIDTDHTTMDEPGDDLEPTNGIDGAVDPTVRSAAAGFSATGLDILDGTSATGRLGEIANEAKLDDAISRGYFGGIADELSQGLSQLNEPYTSSPPSVTVTWGDEICPLLKTSEDDDPTSFYLDSVEALNLPLSFFLAMIRKNISSWVDDDDEIHIRIDELGLEFAETTTEALLRQVTFAQLVALHNTLLKNDDPDADRGFNIILTTRPNCTFRLKELVQGANSGKGLSAFQPTPKSSVSSSASDADDAASDEVSPAEKEYEEAAQREESYEQDDTGGGQGYSEADSDAEDEEDDVVDYDAQAQDGDDADEHNAEDELDLISYTHDEETEMQNTGAAASNRDSEEAAYTTGFDEQADDLLSYDDETDVAQVRSGGDDGDVHAATGSPAGGPQLDYALTADGHENDDSGDNMAYLELDHGTTPHDDVLSGDHQHGEAEVLDDDEYLDLDGDTGHDYITDKVTVQDTQKPFEANGQSSATSTVHGDEIDYEDHPAGNTNGESAVAGQESLQDLDNGTCDQQGGLDEIDWDDEDKILAPNADASPTISITGKRNREDEADELPDEGHDTKRHRQEQVLF